MTGPWLAYLRTPAGQIRLIGFVYATAVLMALVALSLRGAVFEGWIVQKFSPMPAALRGLAEQAAGQGANPGAAAALSEPELALVYGALIDGSLKDDGNHLKKALAAAKPSLLAEQVRITLVAGSKAQKLAALDVLDVLLDGKGWEVENLVSLLSYAQVRAQRTRDPDLGQRVAEIWERQSSRPPPR
jgi:hypothetical protein